MAAFDCVGRCPAADRTVNGGNHVILTGQDHLITTVDGAISDKTTTHTLESSHSPFLSQPANLSKILIDICAQSLAEQGAEAR